MRRFRGTYTVTVTPFTEDGRTIDGGALGRLIEFQVTEGIHGLIPLGSTGEALSVSDDERDEVVETVVKQAAGRVPVVPGCTAENTNDAIRYARSAERLGVGDVRVEVDALAGPRARRERVERDFGAGHPVDDAWPRPLELVENLLGVDGCPPAGHSPETAHTAHQAGPLRETLGSRSA